MDELFHNQIRQLGHHHFLILYWVAKAESQKSKYNITNAYDDLKFLKITRTKQTAVTYVESLNTLCFITIKEEHNRKNLYISDYGARALESLNQTEEFVVQPSNFLEE